MATQARWRGLLSARSPGGWRADDCGNVVVESSHDASPQGSLRLKVREAESLRLHPAGAAGSVMETQRRGCERVSHK